MTFRFPLRRPLSRHGFTLLELAIVLTIVGLIISGIWVYGGQVLYNVKVEKLEAQVIHIITRSHEVFGNNSVPLNSDLTQSAITANIFPSETLVATAGAASGFTANEPFSSAAGAAGIYDLAYANTGGPTTNAFILSIPFVPDDVCTSFLTYMGNSSTVRQLGLIAFGPTGTFNLNPFSLNRTVAWFAFYCSGDSIRGNGLSIYFTV